MVRTTRRHTTLDSWRVAGRCCAAAAAGTMPQHLGGHISPKTPGSGRTAWPSLKAAPAARAVPPLMPLLARFAPASGARFHLAAAPQPTHMTGTGFPPPQCPDGPMPSLARPAKWQPHPSESLVVRRLIPVCFILGAGMELFMEKVPIGGRTCDPTLPRASATRSSSPVPRTHSRGRVCPQVLRRGHAEGGRAPLRNGPARGGPGRAGAEAAAGETAVENLAIIWPSSASWRVPSAAAGVLAGPSQRRGTAAVPGSAHGACGCTHSGTQMRAPPAVASLFAACGSSLLPT